MKHIRSLGIQLLLTLLIVSLIVCQSSASSHSSVKHKSQPIRSQIKNALNQNQEIRIGINVFNSTHKIYQTIFDTLYSSDIEQKVLPIQVQIFETMDNITMECIFSSKDQYTSEFVESWRGYANLTKFKKITKMNSEEFFASGQVGSSSNNNQKGNYTLHIAQNFNIMILYSQMSLPGQELHLFRKLNFTVTNFEFNGISNEAKYFPRLDISQMHIPYKYYKPISGLLIDNETLDMQKNEVESAQKVVNQSEDPQIKNHTINLHIYPYDLMKYAVFFQMFDPSGRQEAMKMNPLMQYMMDQEAYDDMKELLFTNNLYIVALTMIMTLVKTVLQIFALKNEFKVWNEIQKNKGLSIKILYTDLLFQVVFFLYLVDNQSNLMMTIPLGFNILVVLWKIKKTIYIETSNSFPFVKFRHYDWCRHHEKIDNEGVTYMYYGLTALFVLYLGYEAIVSASILSIFTYSGMLEKIVFFMGMAGFIRMTPQLYINYKLKSVDHLPWRTLIYRFIETIIDDFYVFLVTTPFLHKIMVFRQDVIFLLYIYQRVIYKTDPNRIGTAGGMVLEKEQFEKAANSLNQNKSGKNE